MVTVRDNDHYELRLANGEHLGSILDEVRNDAYRLGMIAGADSA